MRGAFLFALILVSSVLCVGSAAEEGAILSAAHTSLTYPPRELDQSTGHKFVYIRVSRVVNPRTIPVAIEVHVQPPGGAKIYLGGFALFPADNPGEFIVPSQGKIDCGGQVLVSLQGEVIEAQAAEVEVEITEVRLVDGLEPAAR